MEEASVVIVGAGPGGTYTALRLAALGIRSVLIDRARFPRTKACGDILTSNVIRALHALDPALVPELLAQPWVMPITTSAFVSAQGHAITMPFHSPANAGLGLPACLSARRADFDDFLLQRAALNPLIHVLEGTHVRQVARVSGGFELHTSVGEMIPTPYLVLATGGNSRLVRDLLPGHAILPKHTAVGLRAYFAGAKPAPEQGMSEFFLFGRKHMPGGLYVTPFSDGGMNVNLVIRHDVQQRQAANLQDLMRGYLRDQPLLRERFRDAEAQGGTEGATLFFGTVRRPISGEGLLVVGDAAGLTDATNANGIGHAMISGGIAAEVLEAAKAEGKRDAAFLGRYDAQVYARLNNALHPGRVMNRLFGNRVTAGLTGLVLQAAFKRLNSRAIHELVYSPSTSRTLASPGFYLRLFSKDKG